MVNLQDEFARMPGFYDKGPWTLLEHSDWLETAAKFREADELPRNYWRECNGIGSAAPRDDKAACEDLADVLGKYFRKKEGERKRLLR